MRPTLVYVFLASTLVACAAETQPAGSPGPAGKAGGEPNKSAAGAKDPGGSDPASLQPDKTAGAANPDTTKKPTEVDPTTAEVERLTAVVEKFEKLEPKAATEWIASQKNLQILDVRMSHEFRRGHLKGARSMNITIGFAKKLAALDKAGAYLVYCDAEGKRTKSALFHMAKAGFTNVASLEGGFEAWEAAGQPIEK